MPDENIILEPEALRFVWIVEDPAGSKIAFTSHLDVTFHLRHNPLKTSRQASLPEAAGVYGWRRVGGMSGLVAMGWK